MKTKAIFVVSLIGLAGSLVTLFSGVIDEDVIEALIGLFLTVANGFFAIRWFCQIYESPRLNLRSTQAGGMVVEGAAALNARRTPMRPG